jgi:hypothetical protein
MSDDTTRPGDGDPCDKCGECHPYDWDDDHGWSRRSHCAEREPCCVCDEPSAHECECGNAACAAHWDSTTGICKRCSDGPEDDTSLSDGYARESDDAHRAEQARRLK